MYGVIMPTYSVRQGRRLYDVSLTGPQQAAQPHSWGFLEQRTAGVHWPLTKTFYYVGNSSVVQDMARFVGVRIRETRLHGSVQRGMSEKTGSAAGQQR